MEIRSAELIELAEKYGAHNYHPLPVVLSRGKGSKVWDVEGREYLDFLSCYSALNFGHQHPRLVRVLQNQVEKLAVCSRAFYSEELALFCKELAEFCGLETVLPMNSGAEAVETALKLARKWGYERKKIRNDKAKIIALKNNFHGRTISIVSFSIEKDYRKGFGPFTPGFEVVPFGNFAALEKAIDKQTAAVLLEPIQAEAGILVPKPGYLRKVRELCTEKKVLLMVDEIQTGMGRTGLDFCYQHEDIVPDVVILGKSLGGGLLPVSAVIAKQEVMDVISWGQHGSTFGGNPLGCAVAREALVLLRQEKLSERAAKWEKVLFREFQADALPKVVEVRGKGMLIGIELEASAGGARKYTEALAQKGVLCKETHENVIRIAPPLTIEQEHLMQGISLIKDVLLTLAK